MPLPATGSISFNQVNVEIQRSGTATLSLNDSTVRTVAGVGGSGTQISMSNLRGKSYFTLQDSPNTNAYFDDVIMYNGSTIPSTSLSYVNNGTWNAAGLYSGATNSGNWGSPTTADIGSNYWIRFTRGNTGGSGTSTASTGWLQLNTTRTISATKSNANGGIYYAEYTVQISTDSGGSNIVKTFTGVTLWTEIVGG